MCKRYMQRILSGGIENPVLVDKYMPGTELEVDVISDGEDVLIPGVMEHIERAGVHSGDSIAVYPPYNLNDRMLENIVDSSDPAGAGAWHEGTGKHPVPDLSAASCTSSRSIPARRARSPTFPRCPACQWWIIAARVMVGQKLRDIGCGTGLHQAPPYCAVKVPVFSFEKLLRRQQLPEPRNEVYGRGAGHRPQHARGAV